MPGTAEVTKTNRGIGERFPLFIGENPQSRNEGGVYGVERPSTPSIRKHRSYSLDRTFIYSELFVQLKQESFTGRNNLTVELYECLLQHPDFKDDLEINEYNTHNEILYMLQNKLIELIPEGTELEIFYRNGITIYFHKDINVCSRQNSLALKWITLIEKENKDFYNALVIAMDVMMRTFMIEAWDEGFDAYALERYVDEIFFHTEEEVDDLDGYLEHFSKEVITQAKKEKITPISKNIKAVDGLAVKFLRKISKKKTLRQLKNACKKLNPKTSLEKAIDKWLKSTINLISSHGEYSLHDLIFITDAESEEGQPVIPTDYYKFNWDFDSQFFQFGVETWLNDHAGEIGVIEPRWSSVLESNKYSSKDVNKVESFGKAIQSWFEEGQNVYWKEVRNE